MVQNETERDVINHLPEDTKPSRGLRQLIFEEKTQLTSTGDEEGMVELIKTMHGSVVNMHNILGLRMEVEETDNTEYFTNGIEYQLIAYTVAGDHGIDFILGSYKTRERVLEIMDEIYMCHNSRYEIPKE